jgi:hypothetical protein
MQNKGTKPVQQSKQGQSEGTRPDVRDNLDSRKNEEQDNKGGDFTHNKKDDKSHHLKEKNKPANDLID